MAAAPTRTGVVRRRTARAGRWAVNLLMLLVVVGGAAWLAPAALGYSRYVITGGSMTGTYDKGSIVFEKQEPVADLEVGDVITYLPPADSGLSTLVTHRIIKEEPAAGGGTLFSTKGDANPAPDPWHFSLVQTSQPVVQFSVPHAGWIFIALADRQTRMLLVGVPAGIVALLALVELGGALRGGRRDDEATDDTSPAAVDPALVDPALVDPALVDPALVDGSRIPSQRGPAPLAPVDARAGEPFDTDASRPVTTSV